MIDLTGKRAFVAGVADANGFGWAIAKALIEAGAEVSIGTWPPMLALFKKMWDKGHFDEARKLSNGTLLEFANVVPMDVDYSTNDDIPEERRNHRKYVGLGDFSVEGAALAVTKNRNLDIVIHSVANGPEVKKPLLKTSREGYLSALSSSSYSFVSMCQHFGDKVNAGGAFLNLSYLAAERVIPGYGGGMSSAKSALESDTRTLAFECGRRWKHRVNSISAGPLASRAASAIGPFIHMITQYYELNGCLEGPLTAEMVGNAALFLCSDQAAGVTGTVLHVDRGYHAMGVPGSVGALFSK